MMKSYMGKYDRDIKGIMWIGPDEILQKSPEEMEDLFRKSRCNEGDFNE